MFTDNGATTTTDYTGSYTYENSSLKFINQAEGYIEPDGVGGYDYVYQYKDHLGNVRLSYKDADDNGVIHGASTQIFFDDFEAATGWDGSGASWGQSITAFDDTLTFDGEYSGRIYGAVGTSVAVHSNEWVAIDNDSATDYIYTALAIFLPAFKFIGNTSIPVYRIFGGGARAEGYSWSLVNPRLYGNSYRNFAGLPNVNRGEFMIRGNTKLKNVIKYRFARPLDGNFGRLVPEVLINPNNISINSFKILKN